MSVLYKDLGLGGGFARGCGAGCFLAVFTLSPCGIEGVLSNKKLITDVGTVSSDEVVLISSESHD